MTVWRDDLGHPVELNGPARRVVSLVPSLTELHDLVFAWKVAKRWARVSDRDGIRSSNKGI